MASVPKTSQNPAKMFDCGYRGFESRKAYEDHYSDPAKYAAEIPAMEQYAREAEEERRNAETLPATARNVREITER